MHFEKSLKKDFLKIRREVKESENLQLKKAVRIRDQIKISILLLFCSTKKKRDVAK